MNVVKLGIAGCGWITNNAHLMAIKNIDNAMIKAVYDTDAQAARETANKHNIPEYYNDYKCFLESGVDGILVCSPNFTHKDLSVQALEKGIAVLCEKPIALNSGEMRQIEKAAQRGNSLFIPAFVNRFRYDISKYISEIKNGAIGEINRVEGRWIRRNGVPRPGTWFTNKEKSGGGVLIDLGSHIIDICMLISGSSRVEELKLSKFQYDFMQDRGSKAKWFSATQETKMDINVESKLEAKLKMENKQLIDIKLAWEGNEDGDYTQFIVYGTKGEMKLNTLFGFSNEKKWEDSQIIVELEGKEKIIYIIKEKKNNQIYAFTELLKYYIDCISNNNALGLSIGDGSRVVDTINTLYETVS